MSIHTPGRWLVADHPRCTVYARVDDKVVEVCHPSNHHVSLAEMDANACLIAAAPVMRELLGEVRVMLRTSLKDYAGEPWAQRVIALVDAWWEAEARR
jgi:hypothetical protein